MIDLLAAREGETRSGFLTHAALRHSSDRLDEQLAD